MDTSASIIGSVTGILILILDMISLQHIGMMLTLGVVMAGF